MKNILIVAFLLNTTLNSMDFGKENTKFCRIEKKHNTPKKKRFTGCIPVNDITRMLFITLRYYFYRTTL